MRSSSLQLAPESPRIVAGCAVAAGVFATLWHLDRADPVALARTVAEDGWIEFASALGFAAAGLLFVAAAVRRGPRVRRALWSLYGSAAIFVAGEELSWGQRLLSIPTPPLLKALNYQHEINLHNLDLPFLLDPRTLFTALTLAAILLGASTALRLFRADTFDRWRRLGLPVLSPSLAPLFLASLFCFVWLPVFRGAEVGELFLALATAAWSLDAAHDTWTGRASTPVLAAARRAGFFGALIGLAALGSATLMEWPDVEVLNNLATARARTGRHEQATALFSFIGPIAGAHRTDVVLSHARFLLTTGGHDEAQRLLRNEAARLETVPLPADDAERADEVQQRIEICTLLEDGHGADALLLEALAIGERRLREDTRPNELAKAHWSIAGAYRARGSLAAAGDHARRALETAASPALRAAVHRWIASLPRGARAGRT